MPNCESRLRARLLGTVLPFLICLGGHAALASDTLPGDAIAPPVNVNIVLYYNEFTDAGAFGAAQGNSYSRDTHISTDVQALRYIRTFDISGILSGVQGYIPYVSFLGSQRAGVPQVGPFGPGYASLTSISGFSQPYFGAFAFPINNPATGTYLVIGPWFSAPISSYSKTAYLSAAQNVWIFEPEAGFRTTLLGSPNGQNLSLEVWGEAYFYGANPHSALNGPAIYDNLGLDNPARTASSTPATFHEQPSEELRVYLPFEIYPPTDTVIAPGFYQSFGGKQTYTLANGAKFDSPNRTGESQLRLVGSTFVTHSLEIMAIGEYDVAAQGRPVNRNIELRLATFF
jgi:hypothetical protein